MAYKHRQVKPVTGDIISPEDLNINNREYISEVNGMLDRDNFDESVFSDREIKHNAFNKFYSFRAKMAFKEDTNADFVLSGRRTSWETQDSSDVFLSKVEFEAESDGVLIIEWHGQWVFEQAPTASDTSGPAEDDPQVVSYRILVNGSEIARSFRNIDCPERDCTALFGCFQVPAGNVTVIVQARTYRVKKGAVITEAAETNNATRKCTIKQRELIVNYRKR